eukprot:ctg_4083.g441
MVRSGGCGVGATWWESVGGSGSQRRRDGGGGQRGSGYGVCMGRVMLLGVCYESRNGDDDEACGRC